MSCVPRNAVGFGAGCIFERDGFMAIVERKDEVGAEDGKESVWLDGTFGGESVFPGFGGVAKRPLGEIDGFTASVFEFDEFVF